MTLIPRNTFSPTCNGPLAGGTGLNPDEAKINIQNFCQSFTGTQLEAGQNQTTTYKTLFGNSNMQISVTFTDDAACSGTYTANITSCQDTFYSLIDNCEQHQSKWELGSYGGHITNGCGDFAISTEVHEVIVCGGNPYRDESDMYKEAVARAIEQYCDRSMTLDPDPPMRTGFSQETPYGQSEDNILSEGLMVRIHAQYSEQGQTSCLAAKAFNTKGDECRRKLEALYDECGGPGGGLSENGANGCVLHTMWGQVPQI